MIQNTFSKQLAPRGGQKTKSGDGRNRRNQRVGYTVARGAMTREFRFYLLARGGQLKNKGDEDDSEHEWCDHV